MAYTPTAPFNVPMYLLNPTVTTVKGVAVKRYSEATELINVSFKTFGGTESTSNGVLTVADTVTVETWYRPDIKAHSRVMLAEDNTKVYEVMGEPEDIELRHQFMKFKAQRVAGGA